MVPRLQKRGSSFKGVCAYILHDAGKETRDRVDWTATANLVSGPDDAWFEMFETYRDSDQLKERAGKSARGRKNTTPVLHYMLSWHKDDKPTPEHMREAALSSLKAIGLQDHQALMAAHHDKEHLHVHIVVNTVNPDTGLTAGLKFTKLDLSKWAEGYEREHGIRCEERIKNNAERERAAKMRALDASDILLGRKPNPSRLLMAGAEHDGTSKKPYVPVKHKPQHRAQWLEKRAITDRMKVLRAKLDTELKGARDVTWERHVKQRDTLDAATDHAIDVVRERVRDAYKPRWRNLYRYQRREAKEVVKLAGNPLERAAYVFRNREKLGTAGKPLTKREMMPLIGSQSRLQKRIGAVHEHEKRTLAREAKTETKLATDRVMEGHRQQFDTLRDRQAAERQAEKVAQNLRRQSVSFASAKATLVQEQEAARMLAMARPIKAPSRPAPLPERFHDAAAPPAEQGTTSAQQPGMPANANAPPPLSRAEQIRRDMEAWRARNPGRDLGREL